MVEDIIVAGIVIVLLVALFLLTSWRKKREQRMSDEKPVEKAKEKEQKKKKEKVTLNKGFKYNVSEGNKLKPGKYTFENKEPIILFKNEEEKQLKEGESILLEENDVVVSKQAKIVLFKV